MPKEKPDLRSHFDTAFRQMNKENCQPCEHLSFEFECNACLEESVGGTFDNAKWAEGIESRNRICFKMLVSVGNG